MNPSMPKAGPFLNRNVPPSSHPSMKQHNQHKPNPRKVRYQLVEKNELHNNYHSPSPSSITASIFHILSSLAILIFIALCTFGLVTTLFILYLTIRPFSKPTYRRLACNIGAAALFDAMALLLPNMRIYLTGDSDSLSPVGVSVLVCNHVMEGDWWAILMLARCVGLRGSVKPFLQRNASGSTSSTSNSSVCGGNLHLYPGPGGRYSPPYGNNNNNNNNNNNKSNNINGNDADGNTNNGPHAATHTNINNPPMHMSTSAPLLNASLHQHHHGGFKRNLSHQAVGGGTNTSTNNSPPRSNTTTDNNNNNNNNNNTSSSSSSLDSTKRTSLIFSFLHNLLEFPILSSEHTQNYIADRNDLFSLLRSFASNGAPAPIHLLLFPEGWPEGDDRKSMMTKCMEFAKREGRPQLKHLLLPRTTGFYASLDSLREASPVVYDVTMAYRGYDGGERPFSCDIGLGTIMKLIRGEIPNEVHIRIKRYSMEEVLNDAQWLDKQWAEKDRLLGKFVRCGNFANVDNRGFCRYRVLDTRGHSIESSITALLRLGLIPFAIPVILILFVPLLWGVAWVWIAHRSFLMIFPGGLSELFGVSNFGDEYRYGRRSSARKEEGNGNQDDISNGTDSATGTPFFPATPFASPTHITSWSAPNTSTKDGDK